MDDQLITRQMAGLRSAEKCDERNTHHGRRGAARPASSNCHVAGDGRADGLLVATRPGDWLVVDYMCSVGCQFP